MKKFFRGIRDDCRENLIRIRVFPAFLVQKKGVDILIKTQYTMYVS